MSEQLSPKPSTVAPPASLPESRTMPIGRTGWECPRCGSPDLASAYLIDYSMDKFRSLRLAPKALKLGKLSRFFRPFKQLVPVNAQVCRDCGLVQIEVDPEEFAEAERKYGRR